MTAKKIPIDKVSGPQYRDPWPDDVDEIVEGREYRRTVPTADGAAEVDAMITGVDDILADDGTPTGGTILSMQYDSPRGGN